MFSHINVVCFITATAAATLSISPRKVRQINDPISQILNQLHKIIFITQVWSTTISLWQHVFSLRRYSNLFPMIICRPWERGNLGPTYRFPQRSDYLLNELKETLENPVLIHAVNQATEWVRNGDPKLLVNFSFKNKMFEKRCIVSLDFLEETLSWQSWKPWDSRPGPLRTMGKTL